MFGFVEWDSWLSFILEGALSLAVLVGLILLARRVNASAEADRRRRLQSSSDGMPKGTTDHQPQTPDDKSLRSSVDER